MPRVEYPSMSSTLHSSVKYLLMVLSVVKRADLADNARGRPAFAFGAWLWSVKFIISSPTSCKRISNDSRSIPVSWRNCAFVNLLKKAGNQNQSEENAYSMRTSGARSGKCVLLALFDPDARASRSRREKNKPKSSMHKPASSTTVAERRAVVRADKGIATILDRFWLVLTNHRERRRAIRQLRDFRKNSQWKCWPRHTCEFGFIV
jgi:hypothetical protein